MDYNKSVIDFHKNLTNSSTGFSINSQKRRFEIFSDHINDNSSLLDFGCNVGDFYNYLQNNKNNIKYYGIDINEDYINIAKEKYKNNNNCNFLFENILKNCNNIPECDYVTASGVFCYKHIDDKITHKQILSKLWSKTKKSLMFNMLTSENAYANPDKHTLYSPKEGLDLINNLECSKFRLLHDYLPNDFTIIMFK